MCRVGDSSRVYLAGTWPGWGAAWQARRKVFIVRGLGWAVCGGNFGCLFINFESAISRANRLISKAFSKISLDLRAATHYRIFPFATARGIFWPAPVCP